MTDEQLGAAAIASVCCCWMCGKPVAQPSRRRRHRRFDTIGCRVTFWRAARHRRLHGHLPLKWRPWVYEHDVRDPPGSAEGCA